ncbi:MAG: hypothetical protein F7B61_03200, partial [Caldisphaeraceae archaeon]|nr:hypothetical protein [Caldisphaeraceae archaeon]
MPRLRSKGKKGKYEPSKRKVDSRISINGNVSKRERKIGRIESRIRAEFKAKGMDIEPNFARTAAESEVDMPLGKKIRTRVKLAVSTVRHLRSPKNIVRYLVNYGRAKREIKAEKELINIGYPEEIAKELASKSRRKRLALLKSLSVKSVPIPKVAFRVTETEFAKKAESEGLKPRKFQYLPVEVPETIFVFASPRVVNKFLDKRVGKSVKKSFNEFFENRRRVKEVKGEKRGLTETELVARITHTYEDTMDKLRSKKISLETYNSEDPMVWFKTYHELRKKGEVDQNKDISVLLIDLKKLKDHYEKQGKKLVVVEDPEASGSYMLFTKEGKELKSIHIPPSAIKRIDIGKPEKEYPKRGESIERAKRK